MQDGGLGTEGGDGLPQQARPSGEGLLEIPVLLILVDRRAGQRVRGIGEHRQSRQAVVGARKEAVGIDPSRFVGVLRGGAESEHITEGYVDQTPELIRHAIRVLYPASSRLDLA